MGLFDFLLMASIADSNRKRRQENNSYDYSSYDSGYEDGYNDSWEDHDCDCDYDGDYCDGDCDY